MFFLTQMQIFVKPNLCSNRTNNGAHNILMRRYIIIVLIGKTKNVKFWSNFIVATIEIVRVCIYKKSRTCLISKNCSRKKECDIFHKRIVIDYILIIYILILYITYLHIFFTFNFDIFFVITALLFCIYCNCNNFESFN